MSNNELPGRKKQAKQYISIYGAEGFITGQQYIAELVINRQAKFLKASLPNKFWSDPKYIDWGKKYLNQLRRVNGLIKAGYSIELIIDALNTYDGRWVCSLFNKKLDFILTKLDREKQISDIKEEVETRQDSPNPSDSTIIETLFDKLDISSTTSKPETNKKTSQSKKTRISKLREEE